MAQILIFQKETSLAARFQRLPLDSELTLRQMTIVKDLSRELFDPAKHWDLIAIDFQSDPAGLLQFLPQRFARPLGPPAVVFLAEESADLEWSLRELGADHVVVGWITPRELEQVVSRLIAPCSSPESDTSS